MRLLNPGKGTANTHSGIAGQRQQSRRPRLCARHMRQVLIGTGVATLAAIVATSGWHAARTGASGRGVPDDHHGWRGHLE